MLLAGLCGNFALMSSYEVQPSHVFACVRLQCVQSLGNKAEDRHFLGEVRILRLIGTGVVP